MERRLFTLTEANTLLPQLRRMLQTLLDARQKIIDAQPELWPVLEKAMGNGGSKKAGEMLKYFEQVQRNAQAIQELGIEIKDINTGLVDFPSERDGRVVYLCWRYGEGDIEYWHELDAGFTGRQPL